MVDRVTGQTMQKNAISNLFRITEDLFKAQTEISSGKRINKPSVDPAGMRDALALKTSISQSNQFIRNINNNRILIQSTDSALDSVGNALNRSKELAIGQLSGTATSTTRSFVANEIEQIVSQVLQAGNTKVKNQFIFSGTQTRTTPFEISASAAVYMGNTENFVIEVGNNINVDFTLPGSEIFAADMNPVLTTATSLSDLNAGAGVPSGSFVVTDRVGNSGTVNVSSSATVANVISSINALATNITASINSAQNGILLTDNSSVVTQALMVTEAGGGTTAAALGILGQRNGNFSGTDINPRISASTQISQLNNGSGLKLGSVNIINGAASAAVSLSSATTMGDVINAINNSGTNVTASINSVGNSLRVDSNDASTVAVVNDIGTGTTAESLGIGGGRNVLNTLIKLKQALQKNDNLGIRSSLVNLDSALQTMEEARAVSGGILRRVEVNDGLHAQDIVDQTQQMSDIEDADLVKSASDLAALELALQASLNSTARVLQPSLLDFLR